MLAAIWAAVWLHGEYFHCDAQTVANTEESLGFVMLAATGVCPDSAQANRTCA